MIEGQGMRRFAEQLAVCVARDVPVEVTLDRAAALELADTLQLGCDEGDYRKIRRREFEAEIDALAEAAWLRDWQARERQAKRDRSLINWGAVVMAAVAAEQIAQLALMIWAHLTMGGLW